MTEEQMGESEFGVNEPLVFSRNGRFYDPTRIWIKLLNNTKVDIWRAMDIIARPIDADETQEAFDNLVEVARQAFSLPDFDPETGKGATDEEVFLTCRDYLYFVAEFKKKLLMLPTRWQLGARSEHSAGHSPQPSDGPAPSTESAS